MLQSQKIQSMLHRDGDGVKVENGSRRASTMRPQATHSGNAYMHSDSGNNSDTASATYGAQSGSQQRTVFDRPRRSLSGFVGNGGFDPDQLQQSQPSGSVSHNGTLRRMPTNRELIQQNGHAPATSAAAAAASAAAAGTLSRRKDSDSVAPDASSTAAALATAASSATINGAESPTPDAAAVTSGRLKVRPQIRSWKHTKEKAAAGDAISNLALLASRYNPGGTFHTANTADSNNSTLQQRKRGESNGRGSGGGGSNPHSSDASDRETNGTIATGNGGGGNGSDDDVDDADADGKKGGVGSSLRRKGNSISKRFRDMVGFGASSKSKNAANGAQASTPSNAASSTKDSEGGNSSGGSGSNLTGTGAHKESSPPSSSVLPSPASHTGINGNGTTAAGDSGDDGASSGGGGGTLGGRSLGSSGTGSSTAALLSPTSSSQLTPSPLASLRERDKQFTAEALDRDRIAKDSAHWKPRGSTSSISAVSSMDSNGTKTTLEDLREEGNSSGKAIVPPLRASPSPPPEGGLGLSLARPESPQQGQSHNAPSFIRAVTSPLRPSMHTVAHAVSAGLTSPSSLQRDNSIPLFMRKHSSSDHNAVGGAAGLSTPSQRRDSRLDLGSPMGVLGMGMSGVDLSAAAAGAGGGMPNSKFAQELMALRQHVNQHSAELETQIADSQSHTRKHTVQT